MFFSAALDTIGARWRSHPVSCKPSKLDQFNHACRAGSGPMRRAGFRNPSRRHCWRQTAAELAAAFQPCAVCTQLTILYCLPDRLGAAGCGRHDVYHLGNLSGCRPLYHSPGCKPQPQRAPGAWKHRGFPAAQVSTAVEDFMAVWRALEAARLPVRGGALQYVPMAPSQVGGLGACAAGAPTPSATGVLPDLHSIALRRRAGACTSLTILAID